jgi:DUF971 family protein
LGIQGRLRNGGFIIEATERRGPAIEPREIKQVGDAGLNITWGDGVTSSYKAADLRRACPCAQCVNEWTGQRVLKPEQVSEELAIADISIVGRYALNFRWSDGHETGIYSFRFLREFADGMTEKRLSTEG